MAQRPFESRVEDTVPKIAGDIAVGENLDFQRKWWRFERIIWYFFLLVLVADMLGLFGEGWLSKSVKRTHDGTLSLHYEWVERNSTPSVMTLDFGPAAVHDGHMQVYVSNTVVRSLGAERIAPQPASSAIGEGGITYTFPVRPGNMSMQIALMPTRPGEDTFEVRVPGSETIQASVFVVP